MPFLQSDAVLVRILAAMLCFCARAVHGFAQQSREDEEGNDTTRGAMGGGREAGVVRLCVQEAVTTRDTQRSQQPLAQRV